MKIGVDIHGVLDLYTQDIIAFCNRAISKGHEIHILTGTEAKKAKIQVENLGLKNYINLFSIVDYNKAIGTKMWNDDPRGKGWWMDRSDWVKSKGTYCKENHIDILFDNEIDYAKYLPDFCTFVYVPPTGFEKILRNFLYNI